MWQVLVPIAMGAMSAHSANQKNEAKLKQNMAAAEQTRWSPWTNMGQGQLDMNYSNPDAQAIQGGIQGAMLMQGMPTGFGGDQAAAGAQTMPGQTSLGNGYYASQLDTYKNSFNQKPSYFSGT